MELNDSLGRITSLIKIDTTVAPPQDTTNNILNIVGNGGLVIPKGTTEQRPTNLSGMIRYNTDIQAVEVSNGTYWSSGSNPLITLTTSTTDPDQVVDTLSATAYRTVKYIVQVTSGTDYQTSELLVIHDGTTPSITEYANILTNTVLATFSADISGGNIRLLVTPVNAVTTIKVIRFAITI